MDEYEKNQVKGLKEDADLISFDRCRYLHIRKEKELRSRALVGAILAGIFGFWLGYITRDKNLTACLLPGSKQAVLTTSE